jgi:hypothetical protein
MFSTEEDENLGGPQWTKFGFVSTLLGRASTTFILVYPGLHSTSTYKSPLVGSLFGEVCSLSREAWKPSNEASKLSLTNCSCILTRNNMASNSFKLRIRNAQIVTVCDSREPFKAGPEQAKARLASFRCYLTLWLCKNHENGE